MSSLIIKRNVSQLIKSIILLGGKMRIPYKRLLAAISICTVVFIAGCVDTDVNPIPSSIDYQSQMKVVNLVQGAGTATVTLNGQSLGAVDFGSETPGSSAAFLTIPSGNKTLNASFASVTAQSYRFAATTEYKFRVFLVGTAASNELVVKSQRYIWQTKDSENGKALFPEGMGQIALFNGSPDAVISSVTMTGPDTVTVTETMAMGGSTPYTMLEVGDYTIDVLYNDTEHLIFNYSVASKGRYTAAIYDVAASIKNAVFVDD
jgi:hypothetical protein